MLLTVIFEKPGVFLSWVELQQPCLQSLQIQAQTHRCRPTKGFTIQPGDKGLPGMPVEKRGDCNSNRKSLPGELGLKSWRQLKASNQIVTNRIDFWAVWGSIKCANHVSNLKLNGKSQFAQLKDTTYYTVYIYIYIYANTCDITWHFTHNVVKEHSQKLFSFSTTAEFGHSLRKARKW